MYHVKFAQSSPPSQTYENLLHFGTAWGPILSAAAIPFMPNLPLAFLTAGAGALSTVPWMMEMYRQYGNRQPYSSLNMKWADAIPLAAAPMAMLTIASAMGRWDKEWDSIARWISGRETKKKKH